MEYFIPSVLFGVIVGILIDRVVYKITGRRPER